MRFIIVSLFFLSLPIYGATVKATGQVICRIVAPTEVVFSETLTELNEQVVVYTEDGPTLQIVF